MDLIYWAVWSSSKLGGDELKVVDVGYRFLASYKYHFIRAHENLVQHPQHSNTKSIAIT